MPGGTGTCVAGKSLSPLRHDHSIKRTVRGDDRIHIRTYRARKLYAVRFPLMLHFKYAFFRIFLPPHGLFQRIIRFIQSAIQGLKFLKRFKGKRPLLVPHGKFSHEHQTHGISHTVALDLVCADFRQIWYGIVTQVLIQGCPDDPCICTRESPDHLHSLHILHHAGVEGHSVECVGEIIIEECTQYPRLRLDGHLVIFIYI